MEEARNVLLSIIVHMHSHVGELPLVEAWHYGGGVQNVGHSPLLEAFQIPGRAYGPCMGHRDCLMIQWLVLSSLMHSAVVRHEAQQVDA